MDTSVETRRGILRTVIKNHVISSIFSFAIIFFAFKWAYESARGIVILFTCTSIFHFSGIYSYVYDQPKLDLILKKKYDWLMPLKTGLTQSVVIFLLTGVQFILKLISPAASAFYGIFAKLMNYSFFYFLYGSEGNYHNIPALVLIMIIPVLVAYLAYFMGIKKFALAKVYSRIVYKRKK